MVVCGGLWWAWEVHTSGIQKPLRVLETGVAGLYPDGEGQLHMWPVFVWFNSAWQNHT